MPVIVLLASALVSGCATVREEQKPLAETTMMVTRAGDATTMTWTAQPAVDYVIWYADRRDAQARWTVLPGAERLHGTEVVATDLRGGAALAVAGLAAEGVTTVQGIGHIQRGYADLAGDLRALGARITEQ